VSVTPAPHKLVLAANSKPFSVQNLGTGVVHTVNTGVFYNPIFRVFENIAERRENIWA
jgi:hypothetical protein